MLQPPPPATQETLLSSLLQKNNVFFYKCEGKGRAKDDTHTEESHPHHKQR